MDLARYFSVRQKDDPGNRTPQLVEGTHQPSRGYLPFLANAINDDIREVLSTSLLDLEKMDTGTATVESSRDKLKYSRSWRTSRGNFIIYKRHHEASTIELFYDLFFVANLAYFTAMHQHTDAQSLINYLKLFTLMWFTWLSITLFDVRFSIDCIWNRIHKAIQFGVFTGFVFAGPVFDKYSNSSDAQSYQSFAIVLFVSRVAIAIQYAVVMWQGRMFRQTLLPLGLSVAIHVLAAVLYSVTLVIFPRNKVDLVEQIVWVVIAIAEGLSIFLIAMIWRIVSFKHTHLVERLQLLTLIIVGEGIIGGIKSTACITKGQSNNNSKELGAVIAAVVLLYLMWMLYFDQLSHDRFGTVRQQVWSLLHYPLHMGVLLCVEGNTSLIVWNSAVQALRWMWTIRPADYADPAAGYSNTSAFLEHLNTSMYAINDRFKTKLWNATYLWDRNFTAIENYTATYGFRSADWNNRTGDVVRHMFDSAQVFVFEAHADSLAKLNAVTAPSSSPRTRLDRIYDVFNVTVMQFYIGGGAMLLILALMYWFNKLHKTKYEFGEIINRVVVGFTLIILGIAVVVADKTTRGFKVMSSHWIIPILVFCFICVLVLDNLLLAISHHTSRRNRSKSWGNLTTVDPSGDTAGLTTKYPDDALTPNQMPMSVPMSKEQTAYTPYDSPVQMQDFAEASTRDRDRSRSRARSRSHSLGAEAADNRGDFSYENTPVSALPRGLAIGAATIPPLDSNDEPDSADSRHTGYQIHS